MAIKYKLAWKEMTLEKRFVALQLNSKVSLIEQ